MKRISSLIANVVAIGILAGSMAAAQAQADPAPKTPVHAAELLKLLPASPPEWKITESRGKNTFNQWLRAEATREYTGPLPADAEPGFLPPQVRLTLVDTGGYPAFLGAFRDFVPGPVEGGSEKLMVQQRPAIRGIPEPGALQLQVYVAPRFILRIKTLHAPESALTEWLRLVNLAALAPLNTQGQTELKRPLDMYVIDELSPRRNRVYQLEWTTEEQVEEALRSEEPNPTSH